jgi:signal transduction histidine kinase
VAFLQSARTELAGVLAACMAALDRIAGGESSADAIADFRRIQEETDLEFLHAEIPRAFERTLEGIQRVTDIVRAMKEFAHPGHVEQSAADLNHAVQTTLTVARNEYKYSAEVETELAELPDVICNVSELNQVFLNLIVNAAQAVRESGKDTATGRIRITTRRLGDHVQIRIADNGCGIPKENLEKIFDPFFTTKDVGLGTGQGLAIARSIVVEKHGGEIHVESELGVGTCFVLTLPIEGRCTPRIAA